MPDPLATIRLPLSAPTVPPCDMQVGDVLAQRYRLDAVIGWGGQAVVFQATDLQPDRRGNRNVLAVKLMRADLSADARRDTAAVLGWEATLLRRLRHPALPRLAHIHRDSSLTWLARDLVPGVPLITLATRGGCDPRMVRSWAIQLCALLRYLHTRTPPVICGDLKPANLVLRPDGTLALIDMGAAQTRTQRPPRRPRPRHGTPGYAPPEQLGNWGMDERSDLFSLAVTCYELLTGADPTTAVFQFDLARLDARAPTLAPALRWALALEPARRAPTAAVLHAALATLPPPAPLRLANGTRITSRHDLLRAATDHPEILANPLASGTLDRWLADHPDRALGTLLHDLRIARRTTPARTPPVDILLTAMAPVDGSPRLHATPARIALGAIPLRRWRVWGPPQPLTLRNMAADPLRWELECPTQPDAEVRLLVAGRPMRRAAGVIPPGGRVELAVVASGQAGPRRGALTLRCGAHTSTIPWEATAVKGVPIGRQIVARLDDLDLTQPDLVPALEALARRGVLQRWLAAQGERRLAADLAPAANQPPPDPLELRLRMARMLHDRDPLRFPLLQIHGAPSADLPIVAGTPTQLTLELANVGAKPCVATWTSRCAWARCTPATIALPPGGQSTCVITLTPPPTLAAGSQQIPLELRAGALELLMTLPVQVAVEPWWQRVLRWLGRI